MSAKYQVKLLLRSIFSYFKEKVNHDQNKGHILWKSRSLRHDLHVFRPTCNEDDYSTKRMHAVTDLSTVSMMTTQTLMIMTSTKYLGVDIQSNLAWINHIDRVTKKSNNMLGFLRRNLRSASSETKTNAYITMVRSNLEYCVSAWNPHQKK